MSKSLEQILESLFRDFSWFVIRSGRDGGVQERGR